MEFTDVITGITSIQISNDSNLIALSTGYKITVNYITDIKKIKSMTDEFFENIPKKQHHIYIDNLDNQILQKIPKKLIR